MARTCTTNGKRRTTKMIMNIDLMRKWKKWRKRKTEKLMEKGGDSRYKKTVSEGLKN